MKTFVTKDLYEIKFDDEYNLFYLILKTALMEMEDYRDIWDNTTSLMISNKSNKIIFDIKNTKFSNVERLIWVTEGLVQLMCNSIKYNRLYFAYLLNEQCSNRMKTEPKFSIEFNQFNEIEYSFFRDSDDAFLWLSKINDRKKSSVFSFKKRQKTTPEIQVKRLEEVLKINTKDPIYQLGKKIFPFNP